MSRVKLKNIIFSLFWQVVVPFIKLKLDKLFAKWKEGSRSGSWSNQSAMQKLQRVYIRIYPFIHMSWEVSTLNCLNPPTAKLLKVLNMFAQGGGADPWKKEYGRDG